MSCGCAQTPCNCQVGPAPVCPPAAPETKCDLYRPGDTNCWVEGAPEAKGVCMLDTMCEAQVINSLQRSDQARADLLKVTSDPELRRLATTVPRLPKVEEVDAEQALINKPNAPESIPFYAIFRGQPPFAQ